MQPRRVKPIRLKQMGRGHGSVSEMLATLEDRRSFGHAKARKGAIWTREFLASGKIGKL